MSGKQTRAGEKPAGEKPERSATGRPTTLREIAHTGWKDWDGHMAELKGYLRDNFQDMSSICPDPMKIGAPPPAYVKYVAKPIPAGSLAACPDTEEGKEMRLIIKTSFKDSITAANKKIEKQELDKQPAYEVIRSMCSIALNAMSRILRVRITG